MWDTERLLFHVGFGKYIDAANRHKNYRVAAKIMNEDYRGSLISTSKNV